MSGTVPMADQPRSPPGKGLPSVSVIVPTYREAGNLPELIGRVEQVRIASEISLELLIVDDDSDDGTQQVVDGLSRDWVRLIVRKDARDLSSAVMEGLRQGRGEIAVVMDADLSHPPETIPHLVQAIADGADLAIGSRYVAGGSTDAAWGPFRWLNSRIATWLARPLTAAKDPMSGFFAIRRERVARAVGLDPIGYKIGLELLVRCGCRDVREVAIHFADRKAGESKLSFKQQLRYVRHLWRLMWFKYGPHGRQTR